MRVGATTNYRMSFEGDSVRYCRSSWRFLRLVEIFYSSRPSCGVKCVLKREVSTCEGQTGVWSAFCGEGRLSVEVGFQWRVDYAMRTVASSYVSVYTGVRRILHREAELTGYVRLFAVEVLLPCCITQQQSEVFNTSLQGSNTGFL